MPRISLVVCIYKERDLLERLLQHAEGCYDDLVVVHDGPEEGDPDWQPGPPRPELAIDWAKMPKDAPLPQAFARLQKPAKPGTTRAWVESRGGRFYEHPRIGSLEGQSPFAWWAAAHDWILRLDADEYPSEEMKAWLRAFRTGPAPAPSVSGFTCIWPLWNGHKSLGRKWPDGRIFFFNRTQVRFTGLVEMTPVAVASFQPLPVVLWHQPRRKSYGYRAVIFRRQNWIWRRVIASTLLQRTPAQLPRWSWPENQGWPEPFLSMRVHTVRCLIRAAFISWRWGLRQVIRDRLWPVLYCIPAYGWHHAFVCLEILRLRWRHPEFKTSLGAAHDATKN